jgi:hypothetical protein
MRAIATLLFAALWAAAQTGSFADLNRGHPILDAHNCYPEQGRFGDRIDRALAAGFPVGIEQDLAWGVDGSPVLSHEAKATGGEPTLREYFFEHVRPIVERALKENDRARWPLIVLHFDFKSNEEPLLRAVWDLLGEYESWITTAQKTADPSRLSRLEIKPLLVLTEESDLQEEVFFRGIPEGGRLRLFGSAHTNPVAASSKQEKMRLAATTPPERLLSSPPTNYRRWVNSSWDAVEEGGQRKAGPWTPRDERRLRSLVAHAHKLGYWVRFFTLDGFNPEEDRGWTQSYNFGSRQAALLRWRAAIAAGVDLIATDQYEDMAAALRSGAAVSARGASTPANR